QKERVVDLPGFLHYRRSTTLDVDDERNLGEATPRLDWAGRHSRKLAHYRQLATPITIVLTFATLVGSVAVQRPRLTRSFVRARVGAGRDQTVEAQAPGDGTLGARLSITSWASE